MFDGIKMLCLSNSKDQPFTKCLHQTIVPEDKFLKITNIRFSCPSCGHHSDKVQVFFYNLTKLKKVTKDFNQSNAYIRSYELALQSCDEEYIELTPNILNNDDWTNWNMQISSIEIGIIESSLKLELWEDHNYKARAYVYPHQHAITFNSILRRRSIEISSHEINIDLLKNLIKAIKNYNNSWIDLLDSYMTAAPVDLKDALYTHISGVNSLDELFSDDERYR